MSARDRQGREHYRDLSKSDADAIRKEIVRAGRADRLQVSQARFPWWVRIKANRIDRVDFAEVDLRAVRFGTPMFRKTLTISDSTFTDCVVNMPLHDVVLEGVTFERCEFELVQFRRCILRDCRFIDCRAGHIVFENCTVERVEYGLSGDASWTDSVLKGVRLSGSLTMGVVAGCKCEDVDLSRCSFTGYAFLQNDGRMVFPSGRSAFVVRGRDCDLVRTELEARLSPGSLRVFDKAVTSSEFTAIRADRFKAAPERDLILDALYAHHVENT